MERTILNFRSPLTEEEKELIESTLEHKEITLFGRQHIPESVSWEYVADVIHLHKKSEGHREFTVTLCPKA